mmetsp:Transcript_5218/g.18243  ORF Transcript_5218/g.18243 Transcript_5218/m.18243 type:complete len:219 (+) Transcript_5218:1255-1911(+)
MRPERLSGGHGAPSSSGAGSSAYTSVARLMAGARTTSRVWALHVKMSPSAASEASRLCSARSPNPESANATSSAEGPTGPSSISSAFFSSSSPSSTSIRVLSSAAAVAAGAPFAAAAAEEAAAPSALSSSSTDSTPDSGFASCISTSSSASFFSSTPLSFSFSTSPAASSAHIDRRSTNASCGTKGASSNSRERPRNAVGVSRITPSASAIKTREYRF